MTPTPDFRALIERLEKAKKGSLELDTAICCALYQIPQERGELHNDYMRNRTTEQWSGIIPSEFMDTWRCFTGSIDAALTLVPDGWEWIVSNDPYMNRSHYACVEKEGVPVEGSGGNGPALALCIAALRARSATP